MGRWLLCFVVTSSGALYASSQESRLIVRVQADTTRQYAVVAGPCVKNGCPLAVELSTGPKPLDRMPLGMNSPSADFEKAELQKGDGYGDPADLSATVPVWNSGDDEDESVLVITSFLLQRGRSGILIDQRYGFEHVKRRQVLVAANGNRLVELWREAEGAGPTYSSVTRQPIPEGRDALLFYSIFFSPDESAADKMRFQSLAYDSESSKMVPVPVKLSALMIGPFSSVGQARKLLTTHGGCGRGLWVLPAKEFQKTAEGYVLSTIVSAPDVALAVRSRLTKCVPGQKVSLINLTQDAIRLW